MGEEEELTAKSSRTAEVNIGGSAVFEVYPLSDPGVTYQWSGPDGILEGETGTKLVINNAQKGGGYHCTANDSEGYSFQSVNFTLRISNGFHCDHDGSTLIYVKKGAPVTLTVAAGSDSGVEYTWHAYSEGLDLSDEKGPSVTVPSVNEPVFAVCLVEDKFGNSGYAAFEVDIDTGIYINDIKDIYIRSGERAQITVDAGASEGNCRVSMMVEEGPSLPIAAQNGNTFTTVRLTNDVKVRAIATDDYSGQVDTTFTIHVLPEGGLMKGDVNGDNEISADDLTLLSRFVAGIEPIPSDAVKAACDVTGEGEVTADDLTKLSRKVAGIIQTLD